MYGSNVAAEKFIVHIEDKVKRLHAIFSQQPMAEFSDMPKREHQSEKKCHVCLKESKSLQNKKVRDHCYYMSLHQGAAHNDRNMNYQISDHIPILPHFFSGYDSHLSIKDQENKF